MGDFRVLFSADQIQTRVSTLAQEIDAAYTPDDVLHLISVLRGGVMFTADLMRALSHALTLDFVRPESYGTSTRSSGTISWHLNSEHVTGRNVIIVEDIIDTGHTLAALQERLRRQSPATLRTVCLLDKPERRDRAVRIDFVGFTIPDRFVVGYGLDLDQRHRELPHIAYLGD